MADEATASTLPIDPIAAYKALQKEVWSTFLPFELHTTPTAALLVRFAGVGPGERVLDVACGTGVVAVTAARAGARVDGLDLTPVLLERARENAAIAGVEVAWQEGDAETLPYPDGTFDRVLSQFGHMFAPRPEVVVAEMLRVLRPGGTIAFSTWPPDSFIGRMFALVGRSSPPPPAGVSPPTLWGDPKVVAERLGGRVADLGFESGTMRNPALSPAHYRAQAERLGGPIAKIAEQLGRTDPAKLAAFRRELDELAAGFLKDNVLRQDFLMSRAVKR
jgi:SAM-dependent methyltransferase